MKNLSLFTLLFFSLAALAEDKEPTLDSVFAKPTTLTDQQSKDAEKFNHTGMKQRIVDDACKQKGMNNCDASTIDTQGVVLKGAFGGAVEQHIGKLYGVLFGGLGFLTGSGGPKVKVQEATGGAKAGANQNQAAAGAKDAKGKEGVTEKSDYCAYAAIGYEALAAALQGFLQKQGADSTGIVNDPQLQALAALYETHKARKKTATIQAAVYTATSACYIARATGAFDKGKVVLDWKYWAKMSASSALSALYIAKAAKHGKAMKAVKVVIDSLPKEGQCNPWTDTACFCAEATSKTSFPAQYEEVCVLNNGNIETPKIAMGCATTGADSKVVFDKECNCKKTNSCIKANVKGYNPKFNIGSNFMNTANKGFDLISSGDFDQGQFDQYAMQNGVMAANIKDKFTADVPKVALTPEQKKVADELKGTVPDALTGLTAATPSYTPAAGGLMETSGSALAQLPEDLQKKVEAIENDVKYGSGGAGFENVSETEEGFKMPAIPGTETQQPSTEVISFAEQAVGKADVSNAPETPIFDIISNRYRRSGWDKLTPEEAKK